MSDSGRASQRAAIVTGGTRNIGRAVALGLAREGYAVAVVSRSADADAAETLRQLEAIGVAAIHVAADVGDEGAVARMTEAVVDRIGTLSALVHCVAIRRARAFVDMSFAEWREVLNANLDSAFLCSRSVLPHLRDDGRIVFFSGVTAFIGAHQRAHVVASKAGLVGLARALAIELAPRRITVNCVSPGPIDTIRTADSVAAPTARPGLEVPLGRHGRPSEVAAAVRLLVSDDGAFITGQVLHVNGGLYFGS